ncbi:MAG: hypothetical protein RL684_468 [Pseudomonadota bacterium]
MIAKRIAAPKGTSDFARLARYVVDAQGRVDPRTWTRTADYILDTRHDGAKVGGVRITNCANDDDPASAAIEILACQAKNTRSKGDKTYHLVVAFPHGEQPSLAMLHAIEDRLCAAIGLADHHRLSAVHTDTDHLHVHIAINKVHPTTWRNVEPYYDKARLMAECEAIERDYGLQRTNHGLPEHEHAITRPTPSPRPETGHDHERPHRPDRRTAAALRESYAAAIAEQPTAKSLDSVRTLSSVQLVRFPEGDQVLLPGDARNDVEYGGAAADHAVRRPDRGAARVRGKAGQGVSGKAGDMEAHAGEESLLGWITREVAPAIAGVSSWQELHGTLAGFDLEIKPRGAGLVLAVRGGTTAVKASDVHRSLSATSLARRLGPFEAPAANVAAIRAAKRYRQTPKQPHANAAALFTQFQRARQAAQEARTATRVQIREAHVQYAKDLATYHRKRREAIQRGRMSPAARKAAYRTLAAERANDWKQRKALEAKQRAEVNALHPLPVWQDWLAQRASAGDVDALEALRSRERKQQRFREAWLTAADAKTAKAVVYTHLNPRTDKTGAVMYDVGDGGFVKDTRDGVRVDRPTEAAAFLGLLLASDKYAGQALIVEGSAAFRAEVATLAGQKGVDVQFHDPELERMRRAAADRTRPPAATLDALDAFVADRNKQRATVPTIPPHRRWTANDAGAAHYQGRRRLADGSEAVLLQSGDAMLVMPVSAAQAAKASTWARGQAVMTDANGRFVAKGHTEKPRKAPRR